MTLNSAVIRKKTRPRVHPRCNSYHKKLDFKRVFGQLIKLLNEAMDSSSGVKGEAATGLGETPVKENKIQQFNKNGL